MRGKFLGVLKRKWMQTLAIIASLSLMINIVLFYPGYMSNDTIGHLGQAMGVYPLTDLTPPAMTLLWRMLLDVTGQPSSMLFFQLGVFWAALLLLAIFVWKYTASRKLSLLPLAIGILPFVLTISGVLWKDNQMVVASLLSVSLALCFRYIDSHRVRMGVFIVALLFLWYACLVRYNALLAIIPIVFLVVSFSGLFASFRRKLIVTGLFVILVATSVPLINIANKVEDRHPISAVMLDDLVAVKSAPEIHQSRLPGGLKQALSHVQSCTAEKKLVLNSFWVCASDADRKAVQFTYYDQVVEEWLQTVTTKPFQYALYRTQTFFMFLFTPEGTAYIWQEGITENTLGQAVALPRAGAIARSYSVDFGYRHFSFMYETWFWVAASLCLLWLARRYGAMLKRPVQYLALSSQMYIIGYWPTGATSDYRYIYWPVLACLFGSILILLDCRLYKRVLPRTKMRRRKAA